MQREAGHVIYVLYIMKTFFKPKMFHKSCNLQITQKLNFPHFYFQIMNTFETYNRFYILSVLVKVWFIKIQQTYSGGNESRQPREESWESQFHQLAALLVPTGSGSWRREMWSGEKYTSNVATPTDSGALFLYNWTNLRYESQWRSDLVSSSCLWVTPSPRYSAPPVLRVQAWEEWPRWAQRGNPSWSEWLVARPPGRAPSVTNWWRSWARTRWTLGRNKSSISHRTPSTENSTRWRVRRRGKECSTLIIPTLSTMSWWKPAYNLSWMAAKHKYQFMISKPTPEFPEPTLSSIPPMLF